MATRSTHGDLIVRRWENDQGITEVSIRFSSLDELFASVLSVERPALVDRIYVYGVDDDAQQRTLALTFQSVTIVAQEPEDSEPEFDGDRGI